MYVHLTILFSFLILNSLQRKFVSNTFYEIKASIQDPPKRTVPCWSDWPLGEGWSRIQVLSPRTVSVFIFFPSDNIKWVFVPRTYTSNQFCIHNPSLWWHSHHLLCPDLRNYMKCSACHLQTKSLEKNVCPLSKGKRPAASRRASILKPTKVVVQKRDFETLGSKDPLVTLFPIAKC